MNVIREKVLPVLQVICNTIATENKLKSTPTIRFDELNLHDFNMFRLAIMDLYNSGNLSRESYAKWLGFNWEEEISKREKETKILQDKNIPEFAPKPFSNSPQIGQQPTEITNNE